MAVSLLKGEGWGRETAPEVVTPPVKIWGKFGGQIKIELKLQ